MLRTKAEELCLSGTHSLPRSTHTHTGAQRPTLPHTDILPTHPTPSPQPAPQVSFPVNTTAETPTVLGQSDSDLQVTARH